MEGSSALHFGRAAYNAGQMSRRQLRARAAEIAQGNWASEAVRKAIDQALAAVAAASAAATAATSG